MSKIFSEVDVSPLDSGPVKEPNELTPDEFAQMKRDVELLGIPACVGSGLKSCTPLM